MFLVSSGTLLLFFMIQWILEIWSLVSLPILNPTWTSGSFWFAYCWSLFWIILTIILLTHEKSWIQMTFTQRPCGAKIQWDSGEVKEDRTVRWGQRGQLLTKLWCMYVMKLLTSKMVWTLAHATIWINLKNLLSERSFAKETQSTWFHYDMPQFLIFFFNGRVLRHLLVDSI